MILQNNIITYIILFVLIKITFRLAIGFLNCYFDRNIRKKLFGLTFGLFCLFMFISTMLFVWFITLMLKGQVTIF